MNVGRCDVDRISRLVFSLQDGLTDRQTQWHGWMRSKLFLLNCASYVQPDTSIPSASIAQSAVYGAVHA